MLIDNEHSSSYRLLVSQRRVLKTLRVVAKISFTFKNRIKKREELKFLSLYDDCFRVCLQLLNQSTRTRKYESSLICVLIVLSIIEREFRAS